MPEQVRHDKRIKNISQVNMELFLELFKMFMWFV